MRQRRLDMGVSLDEMAERTRIRRQFLEALEEERFEIFPAETYLKGFLRNYSEALELDADEILALYHHADSAPPTQKAELRAIETELVEPVKRSASLGWLPLLFLLLLLIALAAAFYYFNELAPSGELESEPPKISVKSPQEPAGQVSAAPAPVIEPDNRALPENSLPPEVGEKDLTPASPPAQEPAEAQEFERQDSQNNVSPRQGAVLATPPPGPGAIPFAEARIPEGGATVRLEVREPTDLEIVIDNRPAQSYVLRAGTTLTWRVRRSARIMLGDPSAVQIWLDGRPLDFEGQSEILLKSEEESVS